MNFHRYQLVERLCAAAGGELYTANHLDDGTAVLLKLLDGGNADAADDMRFRHEYGLLQSLNVSEIIRPIALLDDGVRLAMILEHFAGECLETRLAREQRLALPVALSIASQLAHALAALHAADIVHHDIRPANILIADGGRVRLADLSRAASRDEYLSSGHPATVGDWAYLSPEQTGRMNRRADYRTDFYSLGITLHRLLTGQLPFQADDPAGWVHCHIARSPPAVSDLVPTIPRPVSDLVLKLLEKAPEHRYQSANGLRADLERCLSQWQASGRIEPFTLGQDDIPDRLLIPHKLYGRERDLATLLAAFEETAATSTPVLVTVSGYSGVGKSALVGELQKPIVEMRGYFITGKFDQYKHDIPYASLAQAFRSLVRQILGESDARIAQWRDALREALGSNGRLMVTLIPELELVVGPQPPVVDLPPQEMPRRFQTVFRGLLGVFARAEHPLVLFLDDLQWLDIATLDLIEHLMTHPDVRYLLLAGAYRDNEVSRSHPLMHRLAAIRAAGTIVRDIVLAPLVLDDVTRLVADALHSPGERVLPLAQLVFEKTGGNPFFTIQFLTALADEKLLRFDPASALWRWDLSRIHAKSYTDNVVDLMVSKLERLPQEAQDALKQFACLGTKADVATLGLVLGQPAQTVHASLREAAAANLVFLHEDSYAFLHDRIQEAAYLLIPPDARAATHLRIGRILVSSLAPEAIADKIFDVVNQFNRGSEGVKSASERERVAELNLRAGQRAKAATAYSSALKYLAAGTALLPQDRWERLYALIFALELDRAECEFLTGATAAADARLAELARRASDLVDLATVTCLQVVLFTTLGRTDNSIGVVLDYLRRIGIAWSAHPSSEDVRREYERIWQQIGARPIEALLDLPATSDRVVCATMEVLMTAVAPALFTDPNLCCLVAGRMVNLSLEHGNSDASSVGYASLAMVLGPSSGDYPSAFRFGKLGLGLVERYRTARFTARVYLTFGCAVNVWMRHVRTSISLLKHSVDVARRAGDLTHMAYGNHATMTLLFASGRPLAEVQREAERTLDFARRTHFGLFIGHSTPLLRLILTLRGLTPSFGSFDGADFDERGFTRSLEEDPSLSIVVGEYWIRTLQARFFAGDHAAVVAAAEKMQPPPFFFEMAEYHYFTALAHAALCDTACAAEQPRHMQALAEHNEQLHKWAENCPENFANRAALIAAEIARLEGRETDAANLYEQAIHSAHDNGFVQNEAIAYERASAFYRAHGFDQFAELYLRNARNCFLRWGAEGKVRQLEALNPALQASSQRGEGAAPPATATQLDLVSLAKASQAISGQIVLDDLVDTLMRIVLENAGAQTGTLLLMRNDSLVPAAEADVDQQGVHVQLQWGQALAESSPELRLPESILNFVRRSREQVLLADVTQPNQFSGDTYFAHRQPKSVLCLPILRQESLLGVLYLENSLATHAFTPNRVVVLELLASQAAISLENALLYADSRAREARTRRLVDSNIIGIFFFDSQGTVREANDAFLHIVGYARDDLADGKMRVTDMTPPEHRAPSARARDELERTGSCTPFEKEYIRKDGSRVPVLIGIATFEGSQEAGVAFVLDLTERKRAEDALRKAHEELERRVLERTSELRQSNEQLAAEVEERKRAEAVLEQRSQELARSNKELEQMAYVASHDLQEPLRMVSSYMQLLEQKYQDRLDADAHDFIGFAVDGAKRMQTLIDDLLLYSRVGTRAKPLEPTDCNVVVATALRSLQVAIAESGAQIQVGELPVVMGDVGQLTQLFQNLLANAIKFRGEQAPRVTVWAEPADGFWRFAVQDNGIGIAPENFERIFVMFQRLHSRTKYPGTGIGLAVCKKIVERHGGRIWVEAPGQRTVFKFTLPQASAAGQD